jgi:hypothetical protein
MKTTKGALKPHILGRPYRPSRIFMGFLGGMPLRLQG